MDATQYLSLAKVVEIHDQILEFLGSPSSPLIDAHKLDSALSRPRNAAHYEGADLISQAAILAVAISQSQAFLDGNKRAAFGAMELFLAINGLEYAGDGLEFAIELERIAEAERSDRDEAQSRFETWLRQRVGPFVDEDESGPEATTA